MSDDEWRIMDAAMLASVAEHHRFQTPGCGSPFEAFTEDAAIRIVTRGDYRFRINWPYRRAFYERLTRLLAKGREPSVGDFDQKWSSYLLAIWRRYSGFPPNQRRK